MIVLTWNKLVLVIVEGLDGDRPSGTPVHTQGDATFLDSACLCVQTETRRVLDAGQMFLLLPQMCHLLLVKELHSKGVRHIPRRASILSI